MAQTFPLPTGPAPPAPVRRPAQVRPRSVSPRRSASPRNRRYPSSPRRAASASKYWWRQYGDSPSGGDMAPYLMDMLAAKEDEAADWRMVRAGPHRRAARPRARDERSEWRDAMAPASSSGVGPSR